jgi:flagellar biosynthesis/type III secretory pathway protein FliH
MDKNFVEESFDWIFPELETETSSEEDHELTVAREELEKSSIHKESNEEDNEEVNKEEDSHEYTNEVSLINAIEIENIKTEYHEKIGVINTIIEKLKYPMSIIDDQLIEMVIDIIKKVVMKIIHKEIQGDPSIINNMIKELTSIVNAKDGMVSIYLSQDDYQHLTKTEGMQEKTVSVDNTLKKGDIIVKSNFSEVRALMNERIDHLLRIQYE